MNNTGFFFCGLLVGVVVSAAFGLDFFPRSDTLSPETDPSGVASTGSKKAASDDPGMQSEVDRLTRDKTALEGEKIQLATDLAAAQAKGSGLETDLQATRTRVTQLENELKALPDPSQEAKELEAARGELEQEKRRAQRFEADLELTYQETYNLLRQFFASKRGVEDAILISKYFATSAPEKLKGDLVDQLLKTNREVILSLSPASGMVAGAEGATRPIGGLAPVSAPLEASRPEPAVLKEDNLEGRSDDNPESGASAKNSGETGVELPPPPGSSTPSEGAKAPGR